MIPAILGYGYDVKRHFISIFQLYVVEETGVPGENHQPVASHWQILSYNVVSSTRMVSPVIFSYITVC